MLLRSSSKKIRFTNCKTDFFLIITESEIITNKQVSAAYVCLHFWDFHKLWDILGV